MMSTRPRPSRTTPILSTRFPKNATLSLNRRLPGRPKRIGRSPCADVSSTGRRAGRGFEQLEIKKRHSDFVEWIKPLFPFIRNWTLIDKCLITLSMIVVIRGLYFIPIYGLHPTSLPSDMKVTSAEQMMLEKVFMAEDSIPLNIALLGITPLIASSFLLQIVLNVPIFQYFPGPFQNLLNKKRMGILTNAQIEKTAFRIALMIGGILAVYQAASLRVFSAGVRHFFVTVVMDMMAALSITHFCCNIVQHHGFGEGTGFLLLALTLSGFGKRLWAVATSVYQGVVPLWKLGIVVICYLGIVAACAVFNEVQVRLPLTDYSTHLMRKPQEAEIKALALNRLEMPVPITSAPYFPLPISQSAIQALFFSSSITWFVTSSVQKWPSIASMIQQPLSQMLLYGAIAFCISLIPMGLNATSISEYLAGMEVGIKGVLPGDATIRHVRRKLFQSQLLGGCCTFMIILCCMSLDGLCGIWLGTPIGTLNLILLVGVISTAFKTMEAHVDRMKVESVMQKEKDVMALLQQNRNF